MKLTKVTLTGADDSVTPEDLFKLSKRYPFVEWGILLSRNSVGQKRFPSKKWLDNLTKKRRFVEREINFSAHLCGGYVREILKGNLGFIYNEITPATWRLFQRVQINTHGQLHEYTTDGIATFIETYYTKEFIFQYDDVNTGIFREAGKYMETSFLFDLSHGAGVLPEEWPEPIEGRQCGYAGGLGPDNVEEQIKMISKKVPANYELWIDMETKIRDRNDTEFSLKKCDKVLKICKPYIYE